MVNGVVETAQSYFYTIAVGVVILLIGFGLGVLVKKLLTKVFQEIGLNKIFYKVGLRSDVERWVVNIITYLIYLVTIVFFLNQLGITSIVLYIVLGGILMLIILTFLVGLKDVIPNFVAWILLQRKGKKIEEGRRVEIKEISGRVEKIGYLETEIMTDSGDTLYVPNSLFLKSKFWIKNNR